MPAEYLKIYRIWKYVFLFISIDLMHLYIEIGCYIMFQCSLETAESDFEKWEGKRAQDLWLDLQCNLKQMNLIGIILSIRS